MIYVLMKVFLITHFIDIKRNFSPISPTVIFSHFSSMWMWCSQRFYSACRFWQLLWGFYKTDSLWQCLTGNKGTKALMKVWFSHQWLKDGVLLFTRGACLISGTLLTFHPPVCHFEADSNKWSTEMGEGGMKENRVPTAVGNVWMEKERGIIRVRDSQINEIYMERIWRRIVDCIKKLVKYRNVGQWWIRLNYWWHHADGGEGNK